MQQPAQNPGGQPRLAVGIDVGGTKIAAGLVDLDSGASMSRRLIPTLPARGGAAVLDDVLALAQALIGIADDHERPVAGIGLGVCELVDGEGNITSDHTIAWRGVAVREALSRLAPTAVDADVRAHALAEARYGAGAGFGDWIFVTVGTGISSCLVLGGRPYRGARGNALVLASSPITTTCTVCGALLRPVLEDFAAGPALVARYNLATGGTLQRSEEVLAAAAAGDTAATAIVSSAGEALGVGLGWLVNVLDPQSVVVGGGLGLAGGLYWDSMLAALREHVYADSSRDVPVLAASAGADAGFIGAAALVN